MLIIIKTMWCDTVRTWEFEQDGSNWDSEFARHDGDYRIPDILENIENEPSGYDGIEYNNIAWELR